ncbi:MAG: 50S ribosomal protein L35 [Candidatus Gracilibacteria bacterium]|nr:50S ribosomal protein L35 [Candidatus Gracilibacteria bacterium]
MAKKIRASAKKQKVGSLSNKQKTRSAAKSRVRFTGTGKAKIMKAGTKHLLQQKKRSTRRAGKTGGTVLASPAHKNHLKKCLPHG